MGDHGTRYPGDKSLKALAALTSPTAERTSEDFAETVHALQSAFEEGISYQNGVVSLTVLVDELSDHVKRQAANTLPQSWASSLTQRLESAPLAKWVLLLDPPTQFKAWSLLDSLHALSVEHPTSNTTFDSHVAWCRARPIPAPRTASALITWEDVLLPTRRSTDVSLLLDSLEQSSEDPEALAWVFRGKVSFGIQFARHAQRQDEACTEAAERLLEVNAQLSARFGGDFHLESAASDDNAAKDRLKTLHTQLAASLDRAVSGVDLCDFGQALRDTVAARIDMATGKWKAARLKLEKAQDKGFAPSTTLEQLAFLLPRLRDPQAAKGAIEKWASLLLVPRGSLYEFNKTLAQQYAQMGGHPEDLGVDFPPRLCRNKATQNQSHLQETFARLRGIQTKTVQQFWDHHLRESEQLLSEKLGPAELQGALTNELQPHRAITLSMKQWQECRLDEVWDVGTLPTGETQVPGQLLIRSNDLALAGARHLRDLLDVGTPMVALLEHLPILGRCAPVLTQILAHTPPEAIHEALIALLDCPNCEPESVAEVLNQAVDGQGEALTSTDLFLAVTTWWFKEEPVTPPELRNWFKEQAKGHLTVPEVQHQAGQTYLKLCDGLEEQMASSEYLASILSDRFTHRDCGLMNSWAKSLAPPANRPLLLALAQGIISTSDPLTALSGIPPEPQVHYVATLEGSQEALELIWLWWEDLLKGASPLEILKLAEAFRPVLAKAPLGAPILAEPWGEILAPLTTSGPLPRRKLASRRWAEFCPDNPEAQQRYEKLQKKGRIRKWLG